MPNRILKESIRTSDSINELSWFEEVLFYRLIVSCDDYGRFDGRVAIIKGTCFPLKNVTNKNIEDALNKLVSVGLVRHYEVEEKPYLQLPAWQSHQNIRAKKSRYPSPEEGNDITSDNSCKHMYADVNTSNQMQANVPVIQSNPNTNPNTGSESYTGDSRLDVAFEEYIRFRKQIKKPMTDRAIQLAVGKLRKMSDDVEEQIAIIDQSIMNGWSGLFPLNQDKGNKKTGKKSTRFSNAHERSYDMKQLEKDLLGVKKDTE